MPGRLVSINQAMDLVGVSRRTIYNWLNVPGRLKTVRTAGGSLRIEEASLWRADCPKMPPVAARAQPDYPALTSPTDDELHAHLKALGVVR